MMYMIESHTDNDCEGTDVVHNLTVKIYELLKTHINDIFLENNDILD
jgi:hypothetical protein